MSESRIFPFVRKMVHFCGSLRIALLLILLLGFMCGWGTFVELDFGTSAASLLVYRSAFFRFLLLLLALNILGAVLDRIPWKKNHVPFLCAHLGVLLLLTGCWTTSHFALEGKMAVTEGTSASSILITGSREIVVDSPLPGQDENRSISIPFFGGPFNLSDRTRAGWNSDVYRPALEAVPPKSGVFARLSRFCFQVHYSLTGLALRFSRKPNLSVERAGIPELRRIEITDYLVHGDFRPCSPLSLTLMKQGTEDEPQRVVFRFGNSEKQSSDTITSQRGVRRWLDDGRRIIFMLADSCHEAESLLRAVPESVDGTDDSDGPFFQLVLDSGEKVTRLSYDDLARYIPNYSDSESFTDLSPESDIDLGRGWRLTRIEIVPTVVPGLETVQGWTARLELSQKETGASDRLQLSSDWHERDIQGAASGIVGSLFGTIPGQAEEKILGREWDKNLTKPLIELIQAPDGTLSCRSWDGARRVTTVPVTWNPDMKNTPVKLADDWDLLIDEFMPHDEFGGAVIAAPFSKETADEFYAKARLRVYLKSDSGKESAETFWLRATPDGMAGIDESIFSRSIFDADGRIYRFRLTGKSSALGFSIYVKNFKPVYEPGASIPSSFSSTVDYLPTDENGEIDTGKIRKDVLIKMNHPGVFRSATRHLSFWAYQDSYRGPFYPGNPVFDQTVGGTLLPGETLPRNQIYQTVLSLNADPGRGLKYMGCFLAVLGTALLVFRRTSVSTAAVFVLAVATLSFTPRQTVAADWIPAKRTDTVDWTAWRLLPVFDEGRVMPLNSYAVMTVKEICGTEAPFIHVSPRLMEALDSGTAVSILPLDTFLDGRSISPSQREELERAYNEIKSQKALAQKRAAKRIRELIGPGRKFSAHELLFSWLIEPDVWEYIPFLADPNQTVHRLMLQEGAERTDEKFLSPAELRGSRAFADRVNELADGGTKEYSTWENAVREGKIDRACAMAEGRLSRFDAFVFWPARGKVAAAESELDVLLYPQQGYQQSEQFTLLEELNLAVLELKRLSALQEGGLDSPFDDEDFYPGQTVELGTGGKKVLVLLLISDLHRIAGNWQTDAYQINQIQLRKISEKLCLAYDRLITWQEQLFTEEKGDREFRRSVVSVARLLSLVTEKVEKASCECVIGEWKSAASVPDKTRIRPIPGTEKCLAAPSARFSPRGAGTLSIIPNKKIKTESNGQGKYLVWFPIQSVLWNVSGTPSDNPSTSKQKKDFSPLEGLRAKVEAEGKNSDPVTVAFISAADAYLSNSPTSGADLTRALNQFSADVRRMAETDPADHGIAYPAPGALNAEYYYFRLDPFWGLWFFSLLAFVLLTLSIASGKGTVAKWLLGLGVLFLLAAVIVTAIGGGLRAYITGWAPVTNMFETVVLLAFLVLAVTLFYAFAPLLGDKIAWAWNHSADSTKYRLVRRVSRFLLTLLVLWGTVWVCYHEQGKETGIWRAFADSFAAQGMLDRAAVLATLGVSVWFFPRFLISLVLFPIAPRMTVSERKALMPIVLDRRMFVILGALVAFLIGLLAYYNTAEFNPNIRPLTAVLRSNFWLTVHVLAIMFSYALGVLAWIVSLVVLSGAFAGRLSEDGSEPVLCTHYRTHILTLLRFAVLFLTVGIILGARWADFSWGRFWSWDPKEVWALVTLLIYLFVLHRGRQGLSLPLGGLLGGLSIVMTWYGLSFVFGGGGRHSYASGQSGRTTVLYILLATNLLYGLAAWIVFRIRKQYAERIEVK